MTQPVRISIAALALLLLAAGTAFAVANPVGLEHRSPVAASHEPKPSAEESAAPRDEGDEDGTDKEQAENDEANDAPPSADLVARMVERLSDAGLETDADTLGPLIDAYGVGGAVRLVAWADASGTSLDDLRALRDGGTGWGEIAKQLNDGDASLHLSPGIGWVMSAGHGHGHAGGAANPKAGAATDGKQNGRDTAPGQNRD